MKEDKTDDFDLSNYNDLSCTKKQHHFCTLKFYLNNEDGCTLEVIEQSQLSQYGAFKRWAWSAIMWSCMLLREWCGNFKINRHITLLLFFTARAQKAEAKTIRWQSLS
jgi:hypothetical protein